MDSNDIKVAVIKINNIIASGDKSFVNYENKQLALSLFKDLVVYFKGAPTTAIALVQFLVDQKFELENLQEIEYKEFLSTFNYSIDHLSEKKLSQLRKISNCLLN